MKSVLSLGALSLSLALVEGASTVSPWVPIFPGIEEATGTNDMSARGTLSVNALRMNLQNPEIRLTVTPPITNNYVLDQRETYLQTPREFLVEHGLQVAVNSGYFSPSGYELASGTPVSVEGAVISEGRLVSAQTRTNESMSGIMFATNNQPTFYYLNWPAASTNDVLNALSGMYPLVSNGVNIADFYLGAMSDTIHQAQPRTAFGLSQDNRYLVIITIDGRQDFSDGALDYETAEFLLLFGAWNGMNMDGGGSTCMVKADDFGDAVDINVNSFQWAVGRPGSQRSIGCNFGVRSTIPISPIKDLVATPGSTTAIITWRTDEPANTQVEYGPTKSLGSFTLLDSRLVKIHVATLEGLMPGSNYYFRAFSDTGSTVRRRGGFLRTTNSVNQTLLFDVTKLWKYTTNNLDAVNWTAAGYDDSGWLGPSPGLLYIEDNTAVIPRSTPLPEPLQRTYYFRSHFEFVGSIAGLSLIFSNYIDDGAVFYLNGAEIYRLRMPTPPTIISNDTPAVALPCGGGGDAIAGCPDLFTIPGNLLIQGDNALAVEVHNRSTGPDLVFGSALILDRPAIALPKLYILLTDNQATLYWNGVGFILEQTSQFSLNSSNWVNVVGAINSPTVISNTGTTFYRLRN
jgi:hypothetical protein